MLSIPLYQTGKEHATLSGVVSWQTLSISSAMKSRSILSVSCVISFKLFLLKPGREKQKSLNFFQKPSKTRRCAKEKFDKWWTEIMLP